MDCFLDFQETGASPRKWQEPAWSVRYPSGCPNRDLHMLLDLDAYKNLLEKTTLDRVLLQILQQMTMPEWLEDVQA